jgi:isopropylmalate/homocitrate/citramalate synthase
VAVLVCEVGPRDGLQNEPDVLEPAVRAELVNRLAAAQLRRIECVSFVRPDRVPQMAGAEEVAAGIERRDGVEYAGLVLNERGYERLASTGLDRVNATLAATESFNRRNGNASLEEALARVRAILAAADRPATVTISVSFGCPFEGRVDPGAVAGLAAQLPEAEEIVLSDTIGVATPAAAVLTGAGRLPGFGASASGGGRIGAAGGVAGGCVAGGSATGTVVLVLLLFRFASASLALAVDVASS